MCQYSVFLSLIYYVMYFMRIINAKWSFKMPDFPVLLATFSKLNKETVV